MNRHEFIIKKTPIAVVGLSGLFPGALDLNTFWLNIVNKVDTAREVPANRWIVEPASMYNPDYTPDKAISKRACLIDNFKFNPKGFNLNENLLKEMDPLYHIILHSGKEAFLSCKASSINKKRTGVILAAIALPTDSSSFITREVIGKSFEGKWFGNTVSKKNKLLTKKQILAGKVTSLPAAILAKSLNLGGGSYTLDAACASSLYAVKLACDELYYHRADTMLAGGVSRPESLYTQVGFSQLRALSRSGRCAPFDRSADGLVVGEGAGILVLKRLKDALADGDTIYGLIRGTGLSNDIKGNLLAPDSEGQIRAMHNAYKYAGWSPFDIDLIECHGAGTPVGDTTELGSLRSLWGESGWKHKQCAIGSVKSMIGHLLTGAGAAGMIKTLLALKYKTLPPSINFTSAPEKSPLNNSPFRVQTDAEQWIKKDGRTRRAAVSAFGFGGINAHMLLEEWTPETARGLKIKRQSAKHSHERRAVDTIPAIAIVGMETCFGSAMSLKDFQEAVLNGKSTIREKPETRWKGCDDTAKKYIGKHTFYAGFMEQLSISIKDFHIPPNEITDILPQQLLMLKVAAGAMKDANFPLRKERPRMGAVVGIDFDFEATNFHLRWNLPNLLQTWKKKYNFDDNEIALWIKKTLDLLSPPLTSARTLGALGGIVASRIAREFCFGGPSFVVSGEETSGLRAMEIGIRSLQQYETDAMLVGAVDFSCDIRNVVTSNILKPFSRNNKIRPFDKLSDGTLPGEGAAALVLKRLDQAIKDKNRIYAVVKGSGNASRGIYTDSPSSDPYMLSLKRTFDDAGVSPSSISFVETHGSGNPLEDDVEAEALHRFFTKTGNPLAIGSVKPNIGHTGAVAGLASVVKTSLCLYQEIIPPLANFTEPKNNIWQKNIFHIPACPQYWLRNRQDGPRRACAGAMTHDGNFSHVILEGFEYNFSDPVFEKVKLERKRPLGLMPFGLFILEEENKNSLIKSLDLLNHHTKRHAKADTDIELAAQFWHQSKRSGPEKKYAVSIIAKNFIQLEKTIIDAKNAVLSDAAQRISGSSGFCYAPDPLGPKGKTAFVFPGSGNHYLGMGKKLGVVWPEILRKMDHETERLKTQSIPECFVPQRISWASGWEEETCKKIISDPLNIIFGQVVHGALVAGLVESFGIKPSAVIGYSLGESAGLFAMGAWPDRGEMLKRMEATDLFKTEIAGNYNALRKAWNLNAEKIDKEASWSVAVVNRPADVVKNIISKWPHTRILIKNTPDECVIGGIKNQVKSVLKMLDCPAVFLHGITAVHCDAAIPVADAYKRLHIFPVTSPKGVEFYSCAFGCSYELTSNNAASSILKQAVSGFDFNTTINQAYKDGVRVFLEMGPHSSCTRMISRILNTKPHLAVPASVRGEDDYLTVLKFLGTLIAERIFVNQDKLYNIDSYVLHANRKKREKESGQISIIIGGKAETFHKIPFRFPKPVYNKNKLYDNRKVTGNRDPSDEKLINQEKNHNLSRQPYQEQIFTGQNLKDLIKPATDTTKAVADAHKMFLNFSNNITKAYAETFAFQTELFKRLIENHNNIDIYDNKATTALTQALKSRPRILLGRSMCMEFATGSVGKVMGPDFKIIDTYKKRVRLPDEPLMLVDRIISIEGEKGSLGSGRVVTEHDVLHNSWYMDGGRAPVFISVEAGQADLFLCSYLGIDFAVKGKRTYRLLDATVEFHSGLPKPGDVIRYDIKIKRFVHQNDTYLFFFNFDGYIGNDHLITMTNGCAGFFTKEEVNSSGGIILTDDEAGFKKGKKCPDWKELVPLCFESYDDNGLSALRNGDISGCFGPFFKGVQLDESLWLPGGRLKLIDRILSIDPEGGRYKIGSIRAEADIHTDDWFLTCHFMDDMVMPGTLMYECCCHTLRVFIMRIGWVTSKPGVCFEPVSGVKAELKCRGPVTPDTKHVVYEVEIKEIGYMPEPYAIADANMYADGLHIVMFKNISIKMSNISRYEIEAVWEGKNKKHPVEGYDPELTSDKESVKKKVLFDRSHILTFATGKPSEAFGKPYRKFDEQRFIARLPDSPYSFIDRITKVEPEAWVLKPDGWIEAEHDVSRKAWYFPADYSFSIPFCVLLEIALQPCGWLAAYMGSALLSEKDLRFRNLEGNAVLYQDVMQEKSTLTVRTRMEKSSAAGDMIIEEFEFHILQSKTTIYKGSTTFGFFTNKALRNQVGISNAEKDAYIATKDELKKNKSYLFEDKTPFTPDDINNPYHTDFAPPYMAMPSNALRMIDEIDIYIPDGGPSGLGFIRGVKKVNPEEWFFKAHFFQDPVCPGSLGIESFIQLIKFMAIKRWGHLANTHRFELLKKKQHNWIYRGQIVPENDKVEVEAAVTRVENSPAFIIQADGYLKVDGIYIYKMKGFGIKLVPAR